MLLPLDEPPDLLYRMITHELTHIFEFDIIPQSLDPPRASRCGSTEGLSDYMTGYWPPLDLMTVRDAAVADIVPKMSRARGLRQTSRTRASSTTSATPPSSSWSRGGARKGSGSSCSRCARASSAAASSAYEEAFKLKAEEFDQQFDRYLKDRFKPFRDKERPADYGRDLAPNPEKTRFTSAHHGRAVAVGRPAWPSSRGNRRDQEYDIVLVSAKDGKVIRNLTPGFDQDMGFEYIVDARRPLEHGAVADVVARAATAWRTSSRLGKGKGIVIQDVVTQEGRAADRPRSRSTNPSRRASRPTARRIAFSAPAEREERHLHASTWPPAR